MAAGTRTAPDVTSAPSYKTVSWSVIGINDSKSVTRSVNINGGASVAEIEALIAAIAAMTTGSMHQVKVSDVFSGAESQTNATADGRPSVDDFAVLTGKNPNQNQTRRVYVQAPVAEIFAPNSENILTTQALVVALKTAWDAVAAGYTGSWMKFAEHQESNEASTF